MRERWTDPRLAAFEGCQFPLEAVWNPEIILLNSGRVFLAEPDRVKVGKGGTVTYLQRYRGTLKVPKPLDDFPFDHATLRIGLIPRDLDEKQVRLVVDEKVTGRRREMTVPDWSIGSTKGRITSEYVQFYDQTHSRYDLELAATRRASYFVWKVILPLILIVFMSWVVFWINPVHFGPQIGMSATSMLTLIAFQFAMGNFLPRVNYFTRMDQFILGSTILVFLALVEALTTSYLVTLDKKEPALRLDRTCRWVFPLTFACMMALISSLNPSFEGGHLSLLFPKRHPACIVFDPVGLFRLWLSLPGLPGVPRGNHHRAPLLEGQAGIGTPYRPMVEVRIPPGPSRPLVFSYWL